jgi:hypothetical protein
MVIVFINQSLLCFRIIKDMKMPTILIKIFYYFMTSHVSNLNLRNLKLIFRIVYS